MKSSKPNTLSVILEARYNRRQFLRDTALVVGGLSLGASFGCAAQNASSEPSPGIASQPLRRPARALIGEVESKIQDALSLPPGFEAEVVIAWGDPLFADLPAFDWKNQTADAQRQRFGFNCDYVGFVPLEPVDGCLERGLLCVNHEYTVGSMMFEGYTSRNEAIDKVTEAEAAVEAAAIGHSVVEIRRGSDGWRVHLGEFNRRITLLDTEIDLRGPAAGNDRLQTSQDPEGRTTIGTLANCSGGMTPWGTVLFCEENINDYFSGDLPTSHESTERLNYERYRMGNAPSYPFHHHDNRFRIDVEPNEANRFGWVVEYDPQDPDRRPVKRTSLGRIMREAATVVLNHTGHIVIYSGDDNYFEYMYKWVSNHVYQPGNTEHNRDLLDDGQLFVARCEEDGKLNWLPLKFGQGKLTPEYGFRNQGDVLIETRRASDLVGGTQMDRPEDVETNPVNGKVYAMLTKNKQRTVDGCDGANPRPENHCGHILEMTPPLHNGQRDHTNTNFTWEVFALGGLLDGEAEASSDTLANPDNATFDQHGRLWITSDGAQDTIGRADGVWVCETEGPERATMKRFASVPIGAEATGPCFTPDETTFFLSVQHPGDQRNGTLATATSIWPDGDKDKPPRSAVVAIRRVDGKPITV